MKKIGVVGFTLLILFVTAQAHSGQDELTEVGKSLDEKIRKEMPGWKCHSVQPIQGSSGVIIQQCQSSNVVVKIAITEYSRSEKAESVFKEYKANLRLEEQAAKGRGKKLHLVKEDLSALGDECLVSDNRGSEAVEFRKGKFIVDVSVVRPISNKDAFFARKFADHVAKSLELF